MKLGSGIFLDHISMRATSANVFLSSNSELKSVKAATWAFVLSKTVSFAKVTSEVEFSKFLDKFRPAKLQGSTVLLETLQVSEYQLKLSLMHAIQKFSVYFV